jgi:error-prone DNA polymerase
LASNKDRSVDGEAFEPVVPAVDFLQLAGHSRPDYISPGAFKEKLRKRAYSNRAERKNTSLSRIPYAELRAASAFSFLDGASLPEDLVQRAAELDLPAVALLDRNGVYGAPRFYQAARQAGIKAIVGAEVVLDGPSRSPGTSEVRLSLLVRNRQGYRNLCRLLTAAARGKPKGEARLDWSTLEEHAQGLHCLTGGDEDLVAHTLEGLGADAARQLLIRLRATFDGHLHVELQRHRHRHEEHRNRALVALARSLHLPLAATNGVRYARSTDKSLHDILTCIRQHTHLDAAGRLLAAHRERHFKGATEMNRLFADLPAALSGAFELTQELDFTLADLGYRFPDYPLPPGETPNSYLRHITWNSARGRFRPLTARAQAQIERELAMIEKLDLAGYFLIVWDMVQFCKRESILVQGRGSAANSAVCYALSITAVDPVKMELLFERFLSEERGEWPDIDLDLPSGDQREKVIQYVYQRYGPHGAAMTANVITYRDRSAAREVAKALGYSPQQVDKLAKQLGTWRYDTSRGDPKSLPQELSAAGFDPEDSRIRLFAEMWHRIHNLPRHLGQHSGGMVIALGRLDEVVPLEPAAMENRVVVQWDKDDCADLGIIKVDLLGLGMLQALEEAIPLIHTYEKINLDLAHLPPDDPKTYKMLRQADTVGVFQVESRAQMASLPRNAPRRFYDLVIQVAIIRPGPIVGGMVHPFFERRQGREPVTYPHASLEPILKRTLGILLFQERILRVAMVAAGFSGGEAEDLRRAMGFKRSAERMDKLEAKLRSGMDERGIVGAGQEQIVQAITSFALYGFPESHAASFALIAYASAYLKAHHPIAFLISLLNAWPMGFYYPATLVKDAQRHGVEVHPIDVNHSGWNCRYEMANGKGAARLGLRFVKSLRKGAGRAIEREQALRLFSNADDLTRRCRLQREELEVLAEVGALGSLGLTRRGALWQSARASRASGPLFEDRREIGDSPSRRVSASLRKNEGEAALAPSPLPEMSPYEETLADYAGAGMTTGPHPLEHLRAGLDRHGIVPAAKLTRYNHGDQVRTAGAITVRQRPGTAKGMLFLTLEDETGMSQAIVSPDLLQQHRQLIVGTPGLVVEGVLQKKDGTLSVKAEKFWRLTDLAAAPSHDFH